MTCLRRLFVAVLAVLVSALLAPDARAGGKTHFGFGQHFGSGPVVGLHGFGGRSLGHRRYGYGGFSRRPYGYGYYGGPRYGYPYVPRRYSVPPAVAGPPVAGPTVPDAARSRPAEILSGGGTAVTTPYCREYQTTIVVEGVAQDAFGTVCRQADGTWRIID